MSPLLCRLSYLANLLTAKVYYVTNDLSTWQADLAILLEINRELPEPCPYQVLKPKPHPGRMPVST